MSTSTPPAVTGPLPPVRSVAACLAALAAPLAVSCGGAEEEPGPTTSASAPVGEPVQPEVAGPGNPGDLAEPSELEAFDRGEVDLRRHVPNGATSYVEFESLDALEEAVLRFRSEGDMDGLVEWEPMDMLTPFQSAGVDVQKMSRNDPFAMAVVPLPGGDEDSVVLILPAANQAPLVRSIAAMTAQQFTATRIEGDYVVLQHEDLPATPDSRGAAAVTELLPQGFVRGRMHSSALVGMLGPYLRSAVDEINDQYRIARPYLAGNEVNQVDLDGLFELALSAQEVVFGFELDQDRVTAHTRLVGSEGATERTGGGGDGPTVRRRVLDALGRHVYATDAFARLVVFEPEDVLGRLTDAWERVSTSSVIHGRSAGRRGASSTGLSLDPAARAAMQAAVLKMLRSFENAAAFSFGLEPGDAYAAIYLASSDPARTREAISLMLAKCDLESWGFEMALPVRSIVEETLVEDYSVRFDTRRIDFDERAAMREAFKTYLGDSKLHLKVATSGDHVLLLLGGDTPATTRRIREFNVEAALDPRIATATELVEGLESVEVHHSDVINLIADVASLRVLHIEDMPPVSIREIRRQAEDDPAEVTIWSAVDGADEVFGASFELSGLRSTVEAIKNSGI